MDQSFQGTNCQFYNLSPLSLGDLAEFTEWVQYREWDAFQKLKGRFPPEEFQAESHRILQGCAARQLNESSPAVQATMATLEGSVYLIYLSLRRNHPTITYKEVGDLLTLETLTGVSDKLQAISGISANLKKKAPKTSR